MLAQRKNLKLINYNIKEDANVKEFFKPNYKLIQLPFHPILIPDNLVIQLNYVSNHCIVNFNLATPNKARAVHLQHLTFRVMIKTDTCQVVFVIGVVDCSSD